MSNKDDARLKRRFIRLERNTPRFAGRLIYWLRQPYTMLIRIPLGILLILGGIFSFLPVLGIWMLPLGILLLAVDIPPLRRPVGRFAVWLESRWMRFRRRRRENDKQ